MKVTIYRGGCPQCGKAEGPANIGQSLWFYCCVSKLTAIVGYIVLRLRPRKRKSRVSTRMKLTARLRKTSAVWRCDTSADRPT